MKDLPGCMLLQRLIHIGIIGSHFIMKSSAQGIGIPYAAGRTPGVAEAGRRRKYTHLRRDNRMRTSRNLSSGSAHTQHICSFGQRIRNISSGRERSMRTTGYTLTMRTEAAGR